jgi:hypothetical protein
MQFPDPKNSAPGETPGERRMASAHGNHKTMPGSFPGAGLDGTTVLRGNSMIPIVFHLLMDESIKNGVVFSLNLLNFDFFIFNKNKLYR